MSKKKDDKKQRVSKREQRRLELERKKRQQTMITWGSIGIVVLLLGGLIAWRAFEPDIEGVLTTTAAAGGQHDDNISYGFGGLPPMGGTHRSVWQNCGIYSQPVAPEYAIHTMEHGAVWVTYHPDLAAEDVATLQELVRGEGKILLSPYPDQESPIALTTWSYQLAVDSVDDDRINRFINRYQGIAPEATASCQNGVDASGPAL